jgi:hypothetical protein
MGSSPEGLDQEMQRRRIAILIMKIQQISRNVSAVQRQMDTAESMHAAGEGK